MIEEPASRPELRPLWLGEVIDVAARLVARNFAALVTIMLVLVVWLQIVAPLASYLMAEQVVVQDGQPNFLYADQAALDRANIVSFVLGIITLLGTLAAFGAMMRLLGVRYVTGTAPSWDEAVRFGLRQFGSLLLVGILWVISVAVAGVLGGIALAIVAQVAGAVGAAVGVLLLVAVTTYVAIRLVVAYPAVVEEDAEGTGAIRRSWDLVAGRWWPTFGALLVAFVVVLAFQLGVGVAAVGVLSLDSAPVVVGIVTALNVLTLLLVYPFVAAALIVMYYDLRVRKEGLDLELMAQTLGEPAPPDVATTRSRAAPAAPPEGVRPLDTPPPAGFVSCPACGRHVAAGQALCPYCATVLG